MRTFLSGPPIVKLVNAFARPFENTVAAARTCYSAKGIVTEADVSGDALKDPDKKAARARLRDDLARSIYEAGHHTTLQHAHFQFTLDRVSRHFLWSFLHSHPFYNSEQVSQRYVEVKPGNLAVPPLEGEALAVYRAATEDQIATYQRLIADLVPVAGAEYYRHFAARRTNPAFDKEVKKKAQEVARYVLPVATYAYLYHTVSGLTVLRYGRACEQYDAPLETRLVVEQMVAEVLRHDPLYRAILEEPLPLEATPEAAALAGLAPRRTPDATRAFVEEFDRGLEGRVSRLVDWKHNNEQVLARAVREVLGLPAAALGDDDAIALALDPAHNRWFGESLNLTTLSKLSRALYHPSYTFVKKLSHTADSQDQRHRMTPGSRPLLAAHQTGAPDYITPEVVKKDDRIHATYRAAMERAWAAYARLRALDVAEEFALYVLPNAVAVRFTESSDLLNLHHKLRARLCYNAQEEIWRASVDEAGQIAEVNPRIGRFLLPPCGLRLLAVKKPYCPEGARYCGVPVWKLRLDEYERVI